MVSLQRAQDGLVLLLPSYDECTITEVREVSAVWKTSFYSWVMDNTAKYIRKVNIFRPVRGMISIRDNDDELSPWQWHNCTPSFYTELENGGAGPHKSLDQMWHARNIGC